MSFAWGAYLAVARELVDAREHTAPAEARERSAISRAYYAVFGRALALFRDLGEYAPRRTGDDHESLSLMLSNMRDHRRKRVGDALAQLRRARRWADYERPSDPPRGLLTASASITRAAHALELLDDIERAP